MGKYPNDCNSSYNANRSSGSSQNRSRSCVPGGRNASENSARCRGYESEYARRPHSASCESEYSRRTDSSCGESDYSSRAYGARCENERVSASCCEDSYERRESDACCESGYADHRYVWRPSSADHDDDSCGSCPARLHLHEVQGSTQTACDGCRAHSHRFAAVTSEPVILRNGKHAHRLIFRTDACDGHCHEFTGVTTEEYEICSGHVHYCEGKTDQQAGHCHEFRFVTHIENPTED